MSKTEDLIDTIHDELIDLHHRSMNWGHGVVIVDVGDLTGTRLLVTLSDGTRLIVEVREATS